MTTETNRGASAGDDVRLDDRIRARCRSAVDADATPGRLAETVVARIHHRKRVVRGAWCILGVALVGGAGAGIWQFASRQPAERELAESDVTSPAEKAPRQGADGGSRPGTARTTARLSDATTAQLFATPPPVTDLELIDAHQSALLTGLQTMLDEEPQ